MKRIILAAAVCAAVLSVAGCKKTNKGPSDPVAALQTRGVFVLGLDDAFPPLGYRSDDNEIIGYDIDLAKEVARRLGVEFRAQPIDWDAKEMELGTGKIDCIWNGFTVTEDRKTALSMTFAYLNNAQVLVVRADSGIARLSDMKGRVIGIQSGSSAQEAVDDNLYFKASLADVVYFRDNITALNDLKIGGVDGVVMDSVVAENSIKTTGEPFVIVSESLADEEYGIGFRKNEPALRDKVEQLLLDMAADGTIGAISAKWFDKDISVVGK